MAIFDILDTNAGWKPSAADLVGGMSQCLSCCAACRSICPPSRAMDGCVPCRGTTILCQSAATSRIAKRCCSRVFSCKQRYIKYLDLYVLPLSRAIYQMLAFL